MPSTYTDRLGFELQETGENLDLWGERLNGALVLVDEAIAGVAPISLTGSRTLTNTINAPNEARKAVLIFTDGGLSAIPIVTIPMEQKLFYVENRGATYAITFTAGGTSASLPAGRKGFVFCDGANVFAFDPVALAEDARTGAQAARDLAVKWATQLVTAVEGGEFSAKEYAVGVNASGGSSKSWATKTGSAVAGSEYAAKEYAIGDLTASGGSAKAWATDTSSPDGTAAKSAKTLAGEAGTAASNASSAASASAGFASAASGSADSAANQVTLATNQANRAQGYANTLGFPSPLSAGDVGKAPVVNSSANGYIFASIGSSIPLSARSANTALSTGDKSKLIDLSGTFTQTLIAAATLTADWFVYIRNAGTGVITLDPNGAETIDGLASIRMYPGEAFVIQCDGSSFRTIGRQKVVVIADLTLTVAAAAIAVEAFDGDTELSSIDLETRPLGQGASLTFKKGGTYGAGTYATQILGANNTSPSASAGTQALPFPANTPLKATIPDLKLTTVGSRMLAQYWSGGSAAITILGQSDDQASALQGIRLAASSGNLSIGSTLRVRGYRA